MTYQSPRVVPGLLQTAPRHLLSASELGEAIVGFRSRDERSRPFNLLRTQIVRLVNEGVKVIGITSATPKVGKTFVGCNLAASLSRLPELNTLLIDFDLRRGSVAERFNIPVETGVTEYLSGATDDLPALAWGVEGQRLTIYPTQQKRVLSSELLASARFESLIAAARAVRSSSVVLCDLPPVFANDDSMIACGLMDGYILIAEDGVSTAKQIRDSIRLLGSAKCFGTVLNRYIKGLGIGDYGYGSGYADYYN